MKNENLYVAIIASPERNSTLRKIKRTNFVDWGRNYDAKNMVYFQ